MASQSANRSSRFLWTALGVAGILVLIAVGIVVWRPIFAGNTGVERRSVKPKAPVVKVTKKTLERVIRMPASVEGYEETDIYAKIGGYLKEIHVDIGDAVEKGDVVAVLWVPEMQKQLAQHLAKVEQAKAAVKQAKAKLVQARTEQIERQAEVNYRKVVFDHRKKLVNKKAIQQEKLDEAKYQLEASKAALEAASARIDTAAADVEKAEADLRVAEAARDYLKEMLKYAEIRAPFSGRVSRRWVDPGAYIQPAENNSAAKPLLTLTRLDRLRVVVHLPQSEVRWLNPGTEALVEAETADGIVKRKIQRVAAAMDPKTRTLRLEFDLKQNAKGAFGPRVYPRSYVYVRLFLTTHGDVPVVPASALMSEGKQRFVFVVEDDGTLRKRYVRTLYEDGIIAGLRPIQQVDSQWIGLRGDETIIRTGGGQYDEGMQVVPVHE